MRFLYDRCFLGTRGQLLGELLVMLLTGTVFLTALPGEASGPDRRVNRQDVLPNRSAQYATSAAVNEVTGTLCVAFYDSSRASFYPGTAVTVARSIDRGQTWTDIGGLDPDTRNRASSVVWRAKDGYFYVFTDSSRKLTEQTLYFRSTDDCQTFQKIEPAGPQDFSPAGPYVVVNNWPSSFHYGWLYAFDGSYWNYSADGIHWSDGFFFGDAPYDIHQYGDVSAAIGPNGAIYVAVPYFTKFDRSLGYTEQQLRFFVAYQGDIFLEGPSLQGQAPFQTSFTDRNCGLNGEIRGAGRPRLAIGQEDVLHAVYTAAPDGYGVGDVSNVYYRRSTDQGVTWGPEIQLNDDGTLTDQFHPTISVNGNGLVSVSWYDRRHDVERNLAFDYYHTVSTDSGVTWGPNVRRSDVSSPVGRLDDRDSCRRVIGDGQVQFDDTIFLFWSDDRGQVMEFPSGQEIHKPDIWTEAVPASDYFLSPQPSRLPACSQNSLTVDVDLQQIGSFSEPVQLSVSGLPAGASASWSTNPVMPSGSSTLTLSNLGAAPFGALPIQITGQGSSPETTRNFEVVVDLVHTVPEIGASYLTPPSMLTRKLRPTLRWEYPLSDVIGTNGAFESEIEIATDEQFTNILEVGRSTTREYRPSIGFDVGEIYYWRVRTRNACGWSGYSQTGFVQIPGDFPSILLVDDDDNLPDLWTKYREELDELGYPHDVWDTQGRDEEPTLDDLEPYHTVIWFTAGDAAHVGPSASSEADLGAWLDQGQKCLILSSRQYHRDRGWTSLMQTHLGVEDLDVVQLFDPVVHEEVTGTGTLAGLGPYILYPPFHPGSTTDTLTPPRLGSNAESVLTSAEGAAGLRTETGTSLSYYFGVALLALPGQVARGDVLERLLDDCALTTSLVFLSDFEDGDLTEWGPMP